MLAPTVEAIANQYSETAIVVKLNVDDNPSTAAAYGIKGIPTLILFSKGKEVERVIGATNKETISRMIEKYISMVDLLIDGPSSLGTSESENNLAEV